ncbi:heavy metal sensor histidine kinase [Balneatrix alpica]|uniref:heavy metal sensor histidine kinase n=1 Tax=Balneatrix alpica TaxID=75684 RepID=UPI002739D4D3|nr:heavy metal sensor histidine kinase [Balneatrix alpica]
MGRLSLTWRLTLLFVLVSTSVLLVLNWIIQVAIERHFIEQDRQLLDSKASIVQALVERVQHPQDLSRLQADLNAFFGNDHMLGVRVEVASQVLFNHGVEDFPDQVNKEYDQDGQSTLFEWRQQGRDYRGRVLTLWRALPEDTPIRVLLASDIQHHQQFSQAFSRTLVFYVLAAALVSGLLGWLAVRGGLAPLRVMQARAAVLTANRLDHRLPEKAVPVELAGLAQELNQMLARLEDAFRRLSDFSSDLAHELRTPISNLMTQTQVTLSQSRDAAAYRDALASNAEELERLARIISDMLFLAKAEHGLMLPSCSELQLEQEVAELLEFYDALAEANDIQLSQQGQGSLQGDRLMLRRALSNLLANALRYTPAGGQVVVRISSDEQGVQLEVENQGETIAAEALPHLFERFYRADPARSHGQTEGAGLGLAITQAIVQAHQGQISVRSAAGLTCFCMRFPRLFQAG